MKRVSKSRVILAALIHEGKGLSDPQCLSMWMLTLLATAWGSYNIPRKFRATLLVEGEPREDFCWDQLRIRWSTRDLLQHQHPKLIDSTTRDSLTQQPQIMLAVGSNAYCEACVSYWISDSTTHVLPRGSELITTVMGLKESEVAWHENQDNRLGSGNIFEMALALMQHGRHAA